METKIEIKKLCSMLKFFIIFSLILGMGSCHSNNNGQIGTYKALITPNNFYVPDSLYAFFPSPEVAGKMEEKLTQSWPLQSGSGNLIQFSYLEHIVIFQSDSEDLYDSLVSATSKNAIIKLRSTDSNYYPVYSELYSNKSYDTLLRKTEYKEHINDYLILDFGYLLTDISQYSVLDIDIPASGTSFGLPDDFEIYILKRGYDFVLHDSFKQCDWDILPDKIKNGYTAGLAVSEERNYLIYWAIAW